jgi:nucleotide-binding universal stress UspA family protein
MTRVMVAIDGTDLDDILVDTALRLFGDEAEYWAINVKPEIPPDATRSQPVVAGAPAAVLGVYGTAYMFSVPDPYRPDDAAAQRDLDVTSRAANVARTAFAEHGVGTAHAIGAAGDDPAEVIVRQAEAHDVDVVVVGNHERGWLSRLVNPSVSEDVVEHVPAPVLVVSTRLDESAD